MTFLVLVLKPLTLKPVISSLQCKNASALRYLAVCRHVLGTSFLFIWWVLNRALLVLRQCTGGCLLFWMRFVWNGNMEMTRKGKGAFLAALQSLWKKQKKEKLSQDKTVRPTGNQDIWIWICVVGNHHFCPAVPMYPTTAVGHSALRTIRYSHYSVIKRIEKGEKAQANYLSYCQVLHLKINVAP